MSKVKIFGVLEEAPGGGLSLRNFQFTDLSYNDGYLGAAAFEAIAEDLIERAAKIRRGSPDEVLVFSTQVLSSPKGAEE